MQQGSWKAILVVFSECVKKKRGAKVEGEEMGRGGKWWPKALCPLQTSSGIKPEVHPNREILTWMFRKARHRRRGVE